MKRIAITGATGFIGTALVQMWEKQGYEVRPVPRSLLTVNDTDLLATFLAGCDAIINLAGATINRRWTATYKKEMYESRICTTRNLVKALSLMEEKPSLFVSASAVGCYPDRDKHDEFSDERGNNFLAHICHDWEEAALQCPDSVRRIIVRLGVVCSSKGGALKQMLTIQRLTRVCTVIGSGEQSFPWISLTDVCRVFDYLLTNESTEGIYNLVAPEIVSQRQLANVLSRMCSPSILLPIPTFVLRLILGEGAIVVTSGQRVIPSRLLNDGFTFAQPTLDLFYSQHSD